ncbi:hypothetical protein [Glaciecola sp. KUL10]|uniref:hypothetical protein n=1 Tax=Glaciecola sp. (strain KUL10) TaxID=2161813 RepID=UPI0011B62170|nr:hypothetical protein [Glaciecola sp. KUL10]
MIVGCTPEKAPPERLHLEWNYKYSSHVIHAKLIESKTSISNSNKCAVNFSVFEVLESFKGGVPSGNLLQITGVNAHEVTEEGSEHLLLLIPFVADDFPGYGECSNQKYSNFLSIHNWCCSIDTRNEHSLIVYDMINSEQKSENYLLPTEPIFDFLRQQGK